LRHGPRVLIPALMAFNGWRLWEARPREDVAMISRWISRGEFVKAEQVLRDRIRLSPHDGVARMALARVLGARGDLRGCAVQLHSVPFWCRSKPEALLLEGQVSMMAGRAVDAEAAWKACIADDPLHPIPVNYTAAAAQELIKLYVDQGRVVDARAVMKTLSSK
jgi:hypothetical protein